MKLRCTLLLVLALTLFAGIANADPVDPSVIINDPLTLVSPGCPANATCLFGLPLLPPTIVLQLVNGFFPATSFTYTGPDTNTFYVVLDDVLPAKHLLAPQTSCPARKLAPTLMFSTSTVTVPYLLSVARLRPALR